MIQQFIPPISLLLSLHFTAQQTCPSLPSTQPGLGRCAARQAAANARKSTSREVSSFVMRKPSSITTKPPRTSANLPRTHPSGNQCSSSFCCQSTSTSLPRAAYIPRFVKTAALAPEQPTDPDSPVAGPAQDEFLGDADEI